MFYWKRSVIEMQNKILYFSIMKKNRTITKWMRARKLYWRALVSYLHLPQYKEMAHGRASCFSEAQSHFMSLFELLPGIHILGNDQINMFMFSGILF